jgi:hypothetical protein
MKFVIISSLLSSFAASKKGSESDNLIMSQNDPINRGCPPRTNWDEENKGCAAILLPRSEGSLDWEEAFKSSGQIFSYATSFALCVFALLIMV